MYYYCLYGLSIASDLAFSQLTSISEDEANQQPDQLIHVCKSPISTDISHTKSGYFYIGEKRSYLHNDHIFMEICNGTTIHYETEPNCNLEYVRSFLLGYGMSMLCLQRNILTFHCSAIEKGGYAYLISGESGCGKSTLTGKLLQQGCGFLADDIAAVLFEGEQPIIPPTFPYQKLCRDAALSQGYDPKDLIYIDEEKDKFLVPMHELAISHPIPFHSFVYLFVHNGKELIYEKLEGMDKFIQLIENQFLRHLLGERKFAPSIGQCCLNIAKEIEVHVIGRPRNSYVVDEICHIFDSQIFHDTKVKRTELT